MSKKQKTRIWWLERKRGDAKKNILPRTEDQVDMWVNHEKTCRNSARWGLYMPLKIKFLSHKTYKCTDCSNMYIYYLKSYIFCIRKVMIFWLFWSNHRFIFYYILNIPLVLTPCWEICITDHFAVFNVLLDLMRSGQIIDHANWIKIQWKNNKLLNQRFGKVSGNKHSAIMVF